MITLAYSLLLNSITTSAILQLDVEKSTVTHLNSITPSCIISRIVLLNVAKDGGMFCGGSHNTYSSDSSSWILNGIVSSCFDVDISDDESGMAKDIFLNLESKQRNR